MLPAEGFPWSRARLRVLCATHDKFRTHTSIPNKGWWGVLVAEEIRRTENKMFVAFSQAALALFSWKCTAHSRQKAYIEKKTNLR